MTLLTYPNKKFHICFVAGPIFHILTGDKSVEKIGGAEVQQIMIARGLAARGHRVTMLSYDYAQEDELIIDGIVIRKTFDPQSGIPVLRFVHPRATSVWQAMKKSNADIYYQRSAGMLAGLTAFFCRQHKRRFIYAGAHDTDFMPGQELIQFSRDRWIYHWGLKKADAVIVQNETQLQLCKNFLKQPIYLCRNLYSLPPENGIKASNSVLWVSTIREWKRPELFLEMAWLLPDVNFVMAGGPSGDNGYFQMIKQQAEALPNVTFLGYVPYSEVGAKFERTSIFVNTSTLEGFPNTFLQAWSRRIPTVSFFSPFPEGAPDIPGFYVNDIEHAVGTIQKLINNEEMRQREGERCYQYFLEHHDESKVLTQYEEIFAKVLGQ